MHGRIASDETRAIDIAARNGDARHDRAPKPNFADLVKALWPVKGPAALTQYAGCPDRTARAYASGDREPPWSVFLDLLIGDEGNRVITYVMRDRDPTWWVIREHHRQVYEALQAAAPTLQGIVNACR